MLRSIRSLSPGSKMGHSPRLSAPLLAKVRKANARDRPHRRCADHRNPHGIYLADLRMRRCRLTRAGRAWVKRFAPAACIHFRRTSRAGAGTGRASVGARVVRKGRDCNRTPEGGIGSQQDQPGHSPRKGRPWSGSTLIRTSTGSRWARRCVSRREETRIDALCRCGGGGRRRRPRSVAQSASWAPGHSSVECGDRCAARARDRAFAGRVAAHHGRQSRQRLFLFSKHAIPAMGAGGGGWIILIASQLGRVARPQTALVLCGQRRAHPAGQGDGP